MDRKRSRIDPGFAPAMTPSSEPRKKASAVAMPMSSNVTGKPFQYDRANGPFEGCRPAKIASGERRRIGLEAVELVLGRGPIPGAAVRSVRHPCCRTAPHRNRPHRRTPPQAAGSCRPAQRSEPEAPLARRLRKKETRGGKENSGWREYSSSLEGLPGKNKRVCTSRPSRIYT